MKYLEINFPSFQRKFNLLIERCGYYLYDSDAIVNLDKIGEGPRQKMGFCVAPNLPSPSTD